jgi:hypothetical protein
MMADNSIELTIKVTPKHGVQIDRGDFIQLLGEALLTGNTDNIKEIVWTIEDVTEKSKERK